MKARVILLICLLCVRTIGFSQQKKTEQQKKNEKKENTVKVIAGSAILAAAATSAIVQNQKKKKEEKIAASQVPKPKIWAMVVGISQYADKDIRGLKYADSDAKSFYQYLQTAKAGSVPPENIVLLTNADATRANILKKTKEVFLKSSKEDVIIFYFSGHGMQGMLENTGYLMGSESQHDAIEETGINMSEFKAIIDRSKARKKISYIDACHAGLFNGDGKKGSSESDASTLGSLLQNANDANIVFMSSSGRELSNERDELKAGVFTYFLLRGLSGAADSVFHGSRDYNNGIVTIRELQSYLTNAVSQYTSGEQTPSLNSSGFDTDFPLSVTKPKISLTDKIQVLPAPSNSKGDDETVKANTQTQKPAGNTKQNNNSDASPVSSTKYPVTKDLGIKNCHCEGWCCAYYCFINRFDEPLLLYQTSGAHSNQSNLILPPGKTVCSNRILFSVYRDNDCVPPDREIEFFFKTIDENKPFKYGSQKFLVEACKEITIEISQDNLYLSKDNRH